MATWLIDESRPLSPGDEESLRRGLAAAGPGTRGVAASPTLAVLLQDMVIYDNRKWFGEADVRLDALVVTGAGDAGDPQSFYMPKTLPFSRVADGDRLPIGEGGLLIFDGEVRHFLDLTLMVSRDRKDAADLATMLAEGLKSPELQNAFGALIGLTVAAPQVAAITAALGAAAVIGEFAFRTLSAATGNTIGLYRNSHLQFRDNYGIGPHPPPPETVYRVKDLSFRYDIVQEA